MKPQKALFGTVAHGKGLYTLSLESVGNYTSCTRQGSPDVLKGFNGPVIRFDKAPLDRVLKAISGPVPIIEGFNRPIWPSDKPITVDHYLDRLRAFGIPVENGFDA